MNKHVIATVAVLVLAGCGGQDPEPTTTPSVSAEQSAAPSPEPSPEPSTASTEASNEYQLECSGFKTTNDQGFAELVTECRNLGDTATPELNVTMVGEASSVVVFFEALDPGQVKTATTIAETLNAEVDNTQFTLQSVQPF